MNKQAISQAILVVSFGTSHLDTLEENIVAIEKNLGQAFPNRTLCRAFTSGMILGKLAKSEIFIDDVPTALTKLKNQGYQDILIQPTHIMNGDEYDKLVGQAAPFIAQFEKFALGRPLLTSVEDFHQTAQALISDLPDRRPDTAIIYMGHGTGHFANSAYAQMDYIFRDMGRGDILVGTVEGYPEFPQVCNRLAELGEIKNVILYPMMIVAGDHAKNDLAGAEADSWHSMLEERGYAVTCILQGLGENPKIREIFSNHARVAERGECCE